MSAIHNGDLKLEKRMEMGALSSWATEVGAHLFTEDFGEIHRSIFSRNSFVDKTRARESVHRLSSPAAPVDTLTSFLRQSSTGSLPVSMQPSKAFGSTPVCHQQQLFSNPQHHQQQFLIPSLLSNFDDATQGIGLSSFASSPAGHSEECLIMDQWDSDMSPPSEKRQRLFSTTASHHDTTLKIHHSPEGLNSIREEALPSNSGRRGEEVVRAATTMTTSATTHDQQGVGSTFSTAVGINVQDINEMSLSRFNPAPPPNPSAPLTQPQHLQQQLQSPLKLAVSKGTMPSPFDLDSIPSPNISCPPSFENPVSLPPISGPYGSDHNRVSPISPRGLEDGWPSSKGLSLKGLSSLIGSHDTNTMEQLLVHCAQALENKDVNLAHQIMWVLNNVVSTEGDPNQRVTSCFLKALVRRAGRMVPSLNAMYGVDRLSKAVSAVEYAVMVDITPWYRFGFKAANGALLEAFEGKDRVHIIDFTTTYGMEWPTLIEALSGRPEGPPHVRLTVHKARPDVAPYLGMSHEDVIGRLIMFANTKNVELEVTVVPNEIELLDRSMFDIRDDETTVANLMHRARFISDESADGPGRGQKHSSPRDDFFKMLHSLNPSLVTLIDEEANVTSPSLVARLKSAFNYLWIPFDSLDTFLPRDSPQRVEYELVLSKKIENIIVSEGSDRIERMETKDKWGQRMRKAGYELVPFSEDVSEEVKVMLSDHAAGWGMKHDEDAMLLTWKGHNVLFATAWRPMSSSSPSSSSIG